MLAIRRSARIAGKTAEVTVEEKITVTEVTVAEVTVAEATVAEVTVAEGTVTEVTVAKAPKEKKGKKTGKQRTEKVAEKKKEKTLNDDEDQCSICMETLSVKRLITFSPCSHVTHRTCGIKWIETRSSPTEQCCPLCRSPVQLLVDKTRPTDLTYLALGTRLYDLCAFGPFGQPTKHFILNHSEMDPIHHENRLRTLLSYLNTVTNLALTDVKKTLVEAREAKKNKQFIADINEELSKLKRRVRILADMTRIHKRGGMRLNEGNEVEIEWNYARELAALQDS